VSTRRGRKIRVAVVFGGRSVEHEVSLVSARAIMDALDPERYEVVPIGITKRGRWVAAGTHSALPADPSVGGLIALAAGRKSARRSVPAIRGVARPRGSPTAMTCDWSSARSLGPPLPPCPARLPCWPPLTPRLPLFVCY